MDKPANQKPQGSILLSDYASQIEDTDVLGKSEISPILQGLFGEVGGIMSTVKKNVRESIYPGYKKAAEEEFGDTLWYLAALCRRLEISLEEVFIEAADPSLYGTAGAAIDLPEGGFARIAVVKSTESLDKRLFSLGRSTAALMVERPNRAEIVSFVRNYLDALHVANLSFSAVVRRNLNKARGAFISPKIEDLHDFDVGFPDEERLPRQFRIRVSQRGTGKSYLQWNGVVIGDPLTDNIADHDGYRFHDVFHFAYAAILHWSPVMRALIKHKRKSDQKYDEEQDSGRAIVVEEGLSAWIFSRAKELSYFENQSRVSLDILKTISEFVRGYEVEKCPLKLWEKAILEGFTAFRKLKEAEGGWIIGDRDSRTIQFQALAQEE